MHRVPCPSRHRDLLQLPAIIAAGNPIRPVMTRREKEPGSNLEAARISRLPGDAFYIPGFITEAEETNLLQKVSTSFAFFVRRAYLGPPCIAYSAIDLSNYKGPPRLFPFPAFSIFVSRSLYILTTALQALLLETNQSIR